MKKQETIEEMEKRDAAGYAQIPSRAEEVVEWLPVQVWPEYEEVEPEKGIQQTAATGEETKVIEEALEQAAEIRHALEGRCHHSDSIHDRGSSTMRCSVEGPVDDCSDDDDFLLNASQPSLAAIWDNPDDDIYTELLQCDVDPLKL